jgi:hypothetical protein
MTGDLSSSLAWHVGASRLQKGGSGIHAQILLIKLYTAKSSSVEE